MSALGVVAAYLVGAIPVGLIIARLLGDVDIRRLGSGNIGTTNVLRTMGKFPAALTLVGDVVKGYAAVRLAELLGSGSGWGAAGAVAAIVGNCWSIFIRFSGGKGVATGLGAFLALTPWALAPAALVWVIVILASRYVSLASLLACVCLPIATMLWGYPRAAVAAAVVVVAIIVLRHRQNLGRLLSGTEPRLGERASTA